MPRKQSATTLNDLPKPLRDAARKAIRATQNFGTVFFSIRTKRDFEEFTEDFNKVVRRLEVDIIEFCEKHTKSWIPPHQFLVVVDGVLTKSQEPCHQSVSPPGEHLQHDEPKTQPSKSHSQISSTKTASIPIKEPNQIKKKFGQLPKLPEDIESVQKWLENISDSDALSEEETISDTCTDTESCLSGTTLPLAPKELVVGNSPFSTSNNSSSTVSGERRQHKSRIKTQSSIPELNVIMSLCRIVTAIADTDFELAKKRCVSTLINQKENFIQATDLITVLENLQLENAYSG